MENKEGGGQMLRHPGEALDPDQIRKVLASEDRGMVCEPPAVYGIDRVKLTVKEYLEWENNESEKHEYYQGEVFAMAGAGVDHNRICSNVFLALGLRLMGGPCRPYTSDMRIHIPSNTLFTYPDISVVCGEPNTLNDDKYNVLNPSVLVEVLSPSTRNYDRGVKFELYRNIPSFKEYILVSPDRVDIEIFRLQKGRWESERYGQADGSVGIKSLGISIPIMEIYEGVVRSFNAYPVRSA